MSRDLDFCRDDDLIPDAGASSRPWQCSFCQAEYNRLDIEERLIANVESVVTEWCTQDLKCAKCGGVRVNDFMEHCSCSGEWAGTVKREDVKRKLAVYRRVGEFYGLRMLGDVVEGVWTHL